MQVIAFDGATSFALGRGGAFAAAEHRRGEQTIAHHPHGTMHEAHSFRLHALQPVLLREFDHPIMQRVQLAVREVHDEVSQHTSG